MSEADAERRGAACFARFFDAVDAAPAMRRFVLDELAAPARQWHGLVHHALMLRTLAAGGHDPPAMRRLVLATLFHDIVYDARRGDNEEASAEVAGRWLAGEERRVVGALILATKHHRLDTDPLTRALLLADLGVLWTPSPALYRFYAEGIRREYAHVADDAYRAGRAAVLAGLGEGLRSELDPARRGVLERNLAWETDRLAAGGFDLAGTAG